MPTYAYACTECSHRFETQQAFTDNALTECPECSGRLRKLFNAVGIVFKGSGFYRTDSRRKVGAASDSSGGSGGSSSGSSSSEGSSSSNGSSGAAAASSGSSGSSGSSRSDAKGSSSTSTVKSSAA